VSPTLSRDHPRWPEFVDRHAAHFFGHIPDDAGGAVWGQAFEQASGRCNARAHETAAGSDVHHDPGEALSATISILDALGFDIPSSLEWLHDRGGHCDCTVGINVLGRDDDDEDEVPA
jgi:hypothetical protein